MTRTMKYKIYRAEIEFDDEDRIFVGHVINVNDYLYFHGVSIDELEGSFRDCIENYLERCKIAGKSPDKPYNGVFNVRISPVMHQKMALQAAEEGVSINQFVSEAISEKLMVASR